MQTFSTMRRNSSNKKNLKNFSLSIFLICYVTITDIYYFLPPLFGVAFVLAQENYEEKTYNILYFLMLFFIFFEASKGFPFFSSLLFIMFSFKVLLPKFRKFFGYSKAFIPLFIAYAYFGYFAFLHLLALLFDAEIPQFSWLLGLYTFYEMFLIWIFLWMI